MANKELSTKAKLLAVSTESEALYSSSADRWACQQCGLYAQCESPFLRPYVPEGWTGEYLGIGEAPGADEDRRSKRPFTGKAGQLLMQLWKEAGFAEQDLALHNAARCHPEGNNTPSLTQIRACRPYVRLVIERLRPKMVLAFGLTALKSLLLNGSVTIVSYRGREFRAASVTDSPPCMVTYHPSVVLRGDAEKRERILEDLRLLKADTLSPLTEELPHGKIIGLDTEYGKEGTLFTLGISDGKAAIACEV